MIYKIEKKDGYTQHQIVAKDVTNVPMADTLSKPRFGAGYTLIELMVAIGLFAIVMMLASGSYIMMIGISRQAQGMASGINNLSFALETMTRDIRTGTNYNCGGIGDCSGGNSFSFTNEKGDTVTYDLDSSSSAIQRTIRPAVGGISQGTLTDSSSVEITDLKFYAFGTALYPNTTQAHVVVIIKGTVSPNKNPQNFTIETSATMRGSDIGT